MSVTIVIASLGKHDASNDSHVALSLALVDLQVVSPEILIGSKHGVSFVYDDPKRRHATVQEEGCARAATDGVGLDAPDVLVRESERLD